MEGAGSSFEPVLGALRQFVLMATDQELDAIAETSVAALSRLVPEMVERRHPDAAIRTWTDVDRSWLFGAIAQSFTGDGPQVLLLLDDLQWADRAALLLLARIVADGTRTRVLATCRGPFGARTSSVADFLAALRRDNTPVRPIPLEGLTRDDVVTLVTSLAGAELSLAGVALSADVHRRTNGNAFFVRETLRHLEETGAISPADGLWAAERPLEGLGVPPGVKDVVGQRLRLLRPATVEVLRAAAVIGLEFDVDVLTAVSETDDARVIGALEESLAAGLVRDDRQHIDRYAFVHALVHEVLSSELGMSRRCRLEWRAGVALEGRRPDEVEERVAEIARHLAAGAAVGDPAKAVRWGVRAGDRAMERLAYEEAVRLYDSALSSLSLVRGRTADDRVDLLIALGQAAIAAGDAARWRTACLDAASVARSCGDHKRLARAAIARLGPLSPGEMDSEVLELLEEAVSALRSAPDSPTQRAMLAEVLARQSGYLTNTDPDRSATFAGEAVETARSSHDERVLALSLLYSTQTYDMEREEHLSRLGEAARLADRVGDLEITLLAKTNLMAGGLIWTDREEFDLRLAEYAAIAKAGRAPTHLLHSMIDHAGAMALDGNYAQAREHFRAALQQSKLLGDPNLVANIGVGVFPVNRELARLNVELIARAADRTSNPSARAALVLAMCESGQSDGARQLLREILHHPEPLISGFLRRFNLAVLAEAAHLLNDTGAASTLYGWLRPELRNGDSVIVGPHAYFGALHRYLGLLALTLGSDDEAAAHHETALGVHERLNARGWAARSRYDLARSLVGGGTGADNLATALIDEAVAAAHVLGMPRLLSEALPLTTPALPVGIAAGPAE